MGFLGNHLQEEGACELLQRIFGKGQEFPGSLSRLASPFFKVEKLEETTESEEDGPCAKKLAYLGQAEYANFLAHVKGLKYALRANSASIGTGLTSLQVKNCWVPRDR